MLPLVASADAVEINGIYYNLISKAKQAEVTSNPNKYTGSVVIPEKVINENVEYSVTSLGEAAFKWCSDLTSVTIPNSVTSIGNNAFANCYGLTSVTIPNSVTSIGADAFYYCSGLTSVTIGSGVTSIGNAAFRNCYGLKKVIVKDIAAWCGIKFGSSDSNPLGYAKHIYSDEDIEITNLIIPNSVTSIENRAFQYCKGLTSVTIPNSVTSIGNYAFASCEGLTSVTIGSGVTSIGSEAFSGCSGLTSVTIPNSVSSIGFRAFQNCSGLTSITIGNSVTSIGSEAFSGCSGLKKVIVKDIAAWCGIKFNDYDSNPLSYAKHLYSDEDTEITSLIIPNSVSSIGDYAFRDCSSLTSVTIPNSVTSIRNYAFQNCSGLISITIGSGVTSIGNHAFQYCSVLTSVTIPHSVTSIGFRAFCGCSGLTSITIPNSVTSIGDEAFSRCSGLTSITIPNSVTSIGSSAFSSCSGLTSVTIPNSVTSIGNSAFSSCSGLTSVTIPNSVTSIRGDAFWNCSGLTSVTIPNSVTSIGERAFYNCSGLTSVTIGSGINSIGQTAFASCPELTDVTCYAENVPSTYTDAFKDSYIEYATLHVPSASVNAYKARDPWKNFNKIVKIDMPLYSLSYLLDGEVYKTYQIEEGAAITAEPAPTKEGYTFSGWSEIPQTMPGHDVTVTGTFSVNKYKLIYKVDGVDYKTYEVEYGAIITAEPAPTKEGYTFSGWSETPQTMPAHDVTVTGTFSVNKYKLTYMVDGAEYKSYDVEYGAIITPEAAPTKEGYTFSGWSEIPETMPAHDVTITGTFTQIDYVVGETTYEVQNDEVSVIDGSKQSGEVEIQATVVINNQTYKVTSIADNAFKGNTAITSVTIPNSITQIGTNAFEGCTSLSEINIGNAVSSIGSKAFANITSASNAPRRASGTGLKVSCYAESVPSTASNAFENTSISNGTLLVEDNSVTAYKNSAPWSGFGTIMGFKEATGIDAIIVDIETGAKIYSLDGKSQNALQKGINIVRTSNGKTKKVVIK